MPTPLTDQEEARLAAAGAEIIAGTYESYIARFRELTREARGHFERRDWRAAQADSVLRLDVYSAMLNHGLAELRPLLGDRLTDRSTWPALRNAYAGYVASRADVELAETFFNSFARRVFHTIGVDPAIEFVSPASGVRGYGPPWSVSVRIECQGDPARWFRDVLGHFPFDVGYEDPDGDAARVAEAVDRHLGLAHLRGIELARSVFYRNKGAYVIGKLLTDSAEVPFLLALTNPDGRVKIDAALLTEDEVSIVFSFARSYFQVEMDRPREMVDFLRSIMPRKPLGDLYNAIGFNKHGKTELYRSLLEYLATTDECFEIAPGQRGMVMVVFTLPGFDVVFKIIRDRFDYPKTVDHQHVRDRYRLVFHHDRAGRLVDAQEFEHLEFERERFSEPLLRELERLAPNTVSIAGGSVVIAHLYTERRLRPLDLYLREVQGEAARDAVIDYGQVLRDLAAINIFPGDMLLKNFGVSRHGRLIFYDYDELCLLSECHFRALPSTSDDDDVAGDEPSFYVGDRDIFPEEFRNFLGLSPELTGVFLAHHEELLRVDFWLRMQELHAQGEVLDVYPYRTVRRLAGTERRRRPR
jgi:isocitrate dehydrogenase kinase/phosphatase